MEQKDVQNVEEKTTEKVDTQTTEEKEVKTFTQEEVNTMIQDRLAKEKKKMPSQEELKAYNEWKESQKTEAEKQQEILSKVDNILIATSPSVIYSSVLNLTSISFLV